MRLESYHSQVMKVHEGEEGAVLTQQVICQVQLSQIVKLLQS